MAFFSSCQRCLFSANKTTQYTSLKNLLFQPPTVEVCCLILTANYITYVSKHPSFFALSNIIYSNLNMKTFQFFPKVSILPKSLNSSQKSQFFPTAVLKSSQQSQKEKEREISKIQSISQVQNAEEFYLLLYSIPLRTHLFSPPSICQL